MALIHYQNYTFPFAGLGQTDTWFKRNWGLVLQLLGSLFMIGGVIAQQYINSQVPRDEKIGADDWETMIQAVQRMYPQLNRQQIETRLCELFGARSPFCTDSAIYPAPPAATGIPSWIWLVAIGAGAFLLLK